MNNRYKLLLLMALTAVAGFINGCEADPEPFNPPWCDAGTYPCNGTCISQAFDCRLESNKNDSPAADVPLTAEDPDYCIDDVWGCPGMPCVHGNCWDGDMWSSKLCVGVVVDCNGELVDPGVCCLDDECDTQ